MGTAKRERQKANRAARIQAAIEAEKVAERRRSVRNFAILIAVGAVLVGGFYLVGKKDESTTTTAGSGSSTSVRNLGTPVGSTPPGSAAPAVCPPADGAASRTILFAAAPPMCIDPAKTYTATFTTSEGVVKVALDAKKMPSTTNNFVFLARYHFYDGTQLFRTDPSIDIIQGGAPTNSASDPGPGYTIPDEGGTFAPDGSKGPFTYAPGQLIMARTPAPNSSGSQFFFTTGDKVKGLDGTGTYLLFGQVTEGLDVLQKIIGLHVPKPETGLGGAPSRTVTVTSVTITET